VAYDVCFIIGARPNFMKAAPVYRALGKTDPALRPLLLHTGQHYDDEMSGVFLRELGLPTPDVHLGVGAGSHAEQTAGALVGVERTLITFRPRLVVVSGDVNSTLAGALAAAKLGIPVAHVESGLRSFDATMPEEHNRRLTDHLSAVLFAHSAEAVDNLAREGIDGDLVHLVGNTMIDSVLAHVDRARARAPWRAFGTAPKEYGLVTLHRPSLVDVPTRLSDAVDALAQLAATIPLVFPIHPRTLQRLAELELVGRLEDAGISVTTPVGYLDFLGLEAEARFVLTDSGGIQEETAALGVPCFTLRDSTERPVTVELGTNVLLGARPERMADIPTLLDERKEGRPIPLWDGRAGERVAAVLASILTGRDLPAMAIPSRA
jgi:UDP-N-acetylglucosamine 2-epimerase (non-hydrolysing)